MPYRIDDPFNHGTVLDSTPFTQYYLQKEAKKRAKNEAFDKYTDDLRKTLKPDSVRPQDIKGFANRVNGWMDFYNQNEKAIKNPLSDGGAAKTQWLKQYQDALNYSEDSKGRGETTIKGILPLKNNPEIWDRVGDETINSIALHDLPIDDPRTKIFDITSVNYNPKPFDWGKHREAVVKGRELSEGEQTVSQDPTDKLYDIIKTKKSYSPTDLKSMGEMGGFAYGSDKSLRYDIDKNIAPQVTPQMNAYGKLEIPNPTLQQELNSTFKKVYGRDMEITPENHADLAAAMTLKIAAENNDKIDRRINETRKLATQFNYQTALKDYEHNLSLMDEQRKGIWVDNYIKNGLLKNIPNQTPNADIFGQGYYDVPMSPIERNSLAIGSGKDVIYPDKLQYSPEDNTFHPVYYRYSKDSKGNWTVDKLKDGTPVVDPAISQPLSYEQFKISIKDKAPKGDETAREMNRDTGIGAKKRTVNSGKSYKVKGKPYTHQQLTDMGYTEDQINEAVKNGTIKE